MLDFFEMERVIEELAKAYPAQCATTWFKITKNDNLLIIVVMLVPAVAHVANNEEREKREIENAGIHTLGRLFAHLLGVFGANRTLCGNPGRDRDRK